MPVSPGEYAETDARTEVRPPGQLRPWFVIRERAAPGHTTAKVADHELGLALAALRSELALLPGVKGKPHGRFTLIFAEVASDAAAIDRRTKESIGDCRLAQNIERDIR